MVAFGSPSIPNGLRRVLDVIRPGDNAPKIAAGRSTIAVKRANHRQRGLGNLPLGNSRSKNTTRPRPKTHTQEAARRTPHLPGAIGLVQVRHRRRTRRLRGSVNRLATFYT